MSTTIEGSGNAPAPSTAPRGSRAARRFALGLGALVLPLPVLLQVMQSTWVEPSISADAWLGEPVLGAVHRFAGVSAGVALWLLPLLVGGVAWLLLAGLEALVRAWRIDPGGHAWSSFTWALRSWRGARRWLGFALLMTLALGAAWVGLWKSGLDWMPDPRIPEHWAALLYLSLGFFAGDARNFATEVPPPRWTARWPTRQAWILWGAMVAAFLGIGAAWPMSELPMPVLAAVVAVLWLVSWLGSWLLELAWLDRSGWSGLPALWRRGLQPRVLVARALQWARPILWLFAALLPLVAWAWFFVAVVPMAEATLREHGYVCCSSCCGKEGFWGPVVDASRWLVAWWWFAILAVLMPVSLMLKLVLPWFDQVSWSRLMVELGVVDHAAAAVRPAGGPALEPRDAP